jgi:hypothetical protein
MRAWMVVIQRELQVSALMGERPETLAILRKIDREFARLERIASDAPRPVRFVVLSDHGQTQGETFLQRYGTTLDDLARELCRPDSLEVSYQGDESLTYLSASLTEASQAQNVLGGGLRRVTRGRTVDGAACSARRARTG